MKNPTCLSLPINVFRGRQAPEAALLVGYGALIQTFDLGMPLPDRLALISPKNRRYETDGWQVFTPGYRPEDSLYKHLVFALKYEGINLLFFKKLFLLLEKDEILALIRLEPVGIYCRKIWFLYEWLMQDRLPIPDLTIKKAVPLLDEKQQYALEGTSSPRHRILNNLPGVPGFCPLIFKTKKLTDMAASVLEESGNFALKNIGKDMLQRTSSFLLLKDSRASFYIEGESPPASRAARWGNAIGQAGTRDLDRDELERLQQIVIEKSRFIDMGFRKKGGFVGEHDRSTGQAIPDHISAKWQDLEELMSAWMQTTGLLSKAPGFDAVLAAAALAFGFVFIHPFEDGNGRLHRYLMHHVLAQKKFSAQGLVFPISASILDHIDTYRKVLEAYSQPLLDHIDWRETADHNIEPLNHTIDFYSYYDATKQAEFLYDCVADTLKRLIPDEIAYLIRFDAFKRHINDMFEMPDKMVSMLAVFMGQNGGKLSKRAREKEFMGLTEAESEKIESLYSEIFDGD